MKLVELYRQVWPALALPVVAAEANIVIAAGYLVADRIPGTTTGIIVALGANGVFVITINLVRGVSNKVETGTMAVQQFPIRCVVAVNRQYDVSLSETFPVDVDYTKSATIQFTSESGLGTYRLPVPPRGAGYEHYESFVEALIGQLES